MHYLRVPASILSRLFEPITLLLFLCAVLFLRTGIRGLALLQAIAILVFVVFLPPLVLLFRALRKKTISNWDISNRKQRVRALGIFLGFLIVGVSLISFLGYPSITRFFLFLTVVFVGQFLLTLVYKVSGHLMVATLWSACMSYWYGDIWYMAFGILPFLAWSRVVLKRHTIGQVIAGTLYALVMFYFGIRLGLIA